MDRINRNSAIGNYTQQSKTQQVVAEKGTVKYLPNKKSKEQNGGKTWPPPPRMVNYSTGNNQQSQ